MNSILEATKKQIIVECPGEAPIILPWDLKTIFDFGLQLDDIIQLERGVVLETITCILHLEDTD